jgi:hypothetical protein
MPWIEKSTPESVTSTTMWKRVWTNTSCAASGALSDDNNITKELKVSESWMEGQTNHDWRRRMWAGEILPMTHWRQYQWETVAIPFTQDWCSSTGRRHKNVGQTSISGTWRNPGYDFLLDKLPSVDMHYFVQQAAARIASQGWDALTFIAELSQLRSMLRGILGRLSDLLLDGNLKKVANAWLEARYGWRTLKYEIQDLNQALVSYEDSRKRHREQAGWKTRMFSLETEDVDWGSVHPTIKLTDNVSIDVSYRGVVVADIGVSDFQFNPLVTAWEVTRLSFVIDWLVNIGQALDAITFALSVKQYTACVGLRADFSVEHTQAVADPKSSTVYSIEGRSDSKGYIEMRVPTTVSIIPRTKVRLDDFKLLDLAALVIQRSSGL